MAQQQLSIRSTRARKLARKLAKLERRTVSQVVERALETYEQASSNSSEETGADFWNQLRRAARLDEGPDLDLEAIIRENRQPHSGIDL